MLLDHKLLLLHGLLLPLKLVLSSLNLCKCSCCLLCLACLILSHPLKYYKKCWICLRWLWWSGAGATGVSVVWSRSHLWNWLIIIIRVDTRVTLDHILLLSIKLLLLYRCNAPDDLIMLGYCLWYLWVTARLARCPDTTMM